jgi:hypothetical protein
MQHLEGSGTPVLYIDARFLKVKNEWSYIFTPPTYAYIDWCFSKHRILNFISVFIVFMLC